MPTSYVITSSSFQGWQAGLLLSCLPELADLRQVPAIGVPARPRLVRTAHDENVHQRGHRHNGFPLQGAGALPVPVVSLMTSPTQDGSLSADLQRSHVWASAESHLLPLTDTTAVPPMRRHSQKGVTPWHAHTLNLSNSAPSGPGHHDLRHILKAAPARHNVMSSLDSISNTRNTFSPTSAVASGGHFAVIGSSGLPRFSHEEGGIDGIIAIEQDPGATTPGATTTVPADVLTTPLLGVVTTGAPVAAVTTAPLAPAPPSDAGGGVGTVIFILMAIALLAGVAVAIFRWRTEKGKNSSRLAGSQQSDDSQFWQSAKARQSYRKSAISGQKDDSDSIEDVAKAPGHETSQSGSMASASSEPVKGSSYRSRRMQQQTPDGGGGSRRQMAKARTQSAAQDSAANAGGGTGAAEDVSV